MISKKELLERIEDLELELADDIEETIVDRLENIVKRLDKLEAIVGERKRDYYPFCFSFYGMDEPKVEELSLYEKVEQITNILGIEEKVTHSKRELVKKPVKVETTKKKAKKGKK